EQAVARERVEHVRQERDRRGHRMPAAAVDVELQADLRLLGLALDGSSARHGSLYQVVGDRTNAIWSGNQGQLLALWSHSCGWGAAAVESHPPRPSPNPAPQSSRLRLRRRPRRTASGSATTTRSRSSPTRAPPSPPASRTPLP